MAIIQPITIGNVRLDNNIILAPMAGVSDLPFRVLCADMGAGMTCTEMISAKAIYYNNKNTYELMKIDDRERIVSLQLFGSEPLCIRDMAKRIEDEGIGYDILDINMGCPVPKVVNNGDGSALMKNPRLAGRIMEETVKATTKPVTAKIRIGFDDEHINAIEVAHILEESGASAITVHGRTREQYYSGEANWEIIGEVKSRSNIPIIGNGDVTCYKDIIRMHDVTGCDGYAIGRAARGNPWIFQGILNEAKKAKEWEGSREELENSLVDDGISYKPTWDELGEMIINHSRMLVEFKGEYIGVREMRKHATWYTAGFPNSSAFRAKVNEVESIEELEALIQTILVKN